MDFNNVRFTLALKIDKVNTSLLSAVCGKHMYDEKMWRLFQTSSVDVTARIDN